MRSNIGYNIAIPLDIIRMSWVDYISLPFYVRIGGSLDHIAVSIDNVGVCIVDEIHISIDLIDIWFGDNIFISIKLVANWW